MIEKLKEANADDAQARESARAAIARWAGKMARGGAEEEKIEAVEVACALNARGESEHGQVARMLKTLYEATPPARVRDLTIAAITSCIDCATLGTRRLGDVAALHARHDGTKLSVMNDLVEEALDAPVVARLVQHALHYPSAPAFADAAKAAQVLSGVPGQSTRMADAVLRYATREQKRHANARRSRNDPGAPQRRMARRGGGPSDGTGRRGEGGRRRAEAQHRTRAPRANLIHGGKSNREAGMGEVLKRQAVNSGSGQRARSPAACGDTTPDRRHPGASPSARPGPDERPTGGACQRTGRAGDTTGAPPHRTGPRAGRSEATLRSDPTGAHSRGHRGCKDQAGRCGAPTARRGRDRRSTRAPTPGAPRAPRCACAPSRGARCGGRHRPDPSAPPPCPHRHRHCAPKPSPQRARGHRSRPRGTARGARAPGRAGHTRRAQAGAAKAWRRAEPGPTQGCARASKLSSRRGRRARCRGGAGGTT